MYGYEVIIIKVLPAETIVGRDYPEREAYPSSAKNSDDWGNIAWSYGRSQLKDALERFNGLVAEEREGQTPHQGGSQETNFDAAAIKS